MARAPLIHSWSPYHEYEQYTHPDGTAASWAAHIHVAPASSGHVFGYFPILEGNPQHPPHPPNSAPNPWANTSGRGRG